MAQWEEDFRSRARELLEAVGPSLPACDEVASFLLYEGQMLAFWVKGLPDDQEIYVYLAKVPGSSPRPGDWFPAVLDVFIAERGSVKAGRDLKRETVKARIAEAGVASRWGLLIGLSTPHVLTYSDQTYRISRRAISMNDEGDMKMSFEICRELPAG